MRMTIQEQMKLLTEATRLAQLEGNDERVDELLREKQRMIQQLPGAEEKPS